MFFRTIEPAHSPTPGRSTTTIRAPGIIRRSALLCGRGVRAHRSRACSASLAATARSRCPPLKASRAVVAPFSRSWPSGPTSLRDPTLRGQATHCSRSSLRFRSPVAEPCALRPRIDCTQVTMCPMLQRAESRQACLSSPGVAPAMNSTSTVSADAASMIRWQRRSRVSTVGSFDDATVRTTPLSCSSAFPSLFMPALSAATGPSSSARK